MTTAEKAEKVAKIYAEYAEDAKRTLRCNLPHKYLIANLGMGMAGEAGELFELLMEVDFSYEELRQISRMEIPQLTVELGDCAWYAINMLRTVDASFVIRGTLYAFMRSMWCNTSCTLDRDHIVLHGCIACDSAKKHAFHGHKLDFVKISNSAIVILCAVSDICDYFHLDLKTVLDQNTEKLDGRYPNGFSEYASQNRSE